MNILLKTNLLIGFLIAAAESLLLGILLAFKLIGPEAEIDSPSFQVGGTLLFIGIYLFLLFGVYIGISIFKKRNGNRLTYIEALKTGFWISLFSALVSVLFTYVFYELIYPDYRMLMLDKLEMTFESQNLEPGLIKTKLVEFSDYYSTRAQAAYTFLGHLVTGIFYSILLGVFMKK